MLFVSVPTWAVIKMAIGPHVKPDSGYVKHKILSNSNITAFLDHTMCEKFVCGLIAEQINQGVWHFHTKY